MKTKQQKVTELKDISEKLAKAKIAVITSFARAGEKGLNVKDMQSLKRELRQGESDYVVTKKTVLARAMKQAQDVDGSIGMMFSYGDPYAAAKTIYQFSKKHAALKLLGALMGTSYMEGDAFIEMAKLPTKEVLLSRLVGMLSYPMRSLVVVLNQIKHE